MCGPEDPLFTPLLPLTRVPFQAKESVHKTPFWENLEILASTASIFTQILAHKPPQIWKFSAHKPQNLEIFSSQAPKFGNFPLTSPPFSEANVSSQAPHFGNPGRTPLPEKNWVPPGLVYNQCFSLYIVPIDCIKTTNYMSRLTSIIIIMRLAYFIYIGWVSANYNKKAVLFVYKWSL